MIRRTVRKAFTLVEILIVVVILGILAAIVVPQFTNATQDAQAGTLKAQLSSLNRQIELYRARNNGQLPGTNGTAMATFWTDLINGGYVKSMPVNPAYGGTLATGDSTDIVAAATAGDATAGWVLTTADIGTLGQPNYIPAGSICASFFDEVNGVITAGTP